MQYLSNYMPELTDHEIACKGSYMISYFDQSANCYVTAKYCSLYMFCYLTGLENNQKNRDLIIKKAAKNGFFSLSDDRFPSKTVKIYI